MPIEFILLAVFGIFVVVALVMQHQAAHRAELRKYESAKATAATMVQQVGERSNSAAFTWLAGAGWVIAPFALPAGAAAVVAAHVAQAATRGLNLRKERMPEFWYDQVIGESSQRGKEYLGGLLASKGFITVAQAAKWLEIESFEASLATPSKAALASNNPPSVASRLIAKLPFNKGTSK